MLPTVMVQLSINGHTKVLRGIMDQCVERSLVGFHVLPYFDIRSQPREVKVRLTARSGPVEFWVATGPIERQTPNREVPAHVRDMYADLVVADPEWWLPAPIHIVLGTDVCPRLMKPGLFPAPVGYPMAQSTVLGWALSGPYPA